MKHLGETLSQHIQDCSEGEACPLYKLWYNRQPKWKKIYGLLDKPMKGVEYV